MVRKPACPPGQTCRIALPAYLSSPSGLPAWLMSARADRFAAEHEGAGVAEIELVGDDDGVVVVGDRSAIQRFLDHAALLSWARDFDLGKLSNAMNAGADVLTTASGVVEQSAMYLKLTPESAKRLKDAGGLMKTKTKGVSHAMLGETGKTSLKWLQVEDGTASLLTNPAVLSGVGGLMSQFAQQAEAQELRALLVSIDEKLDDVRGAQRDAVLARMKRAGEAIEEAMTLREHGATRGRCGTR